MNQISANESEYNLVFTLILIGGGGVGKTGLFSRFTRNEFDRDAVSTIGVDFGVKQLLVDNKKVKTQVWDTAGQDRYRTVSSSYFGLSDGALAVFDLADLDTFDIVVQRIGDFCRAVQADVPIILVGNKSDLFRKRQVSREQAMAFAQKLNVPYIETSALNGSNIEEAFMTLIKTIYHKKVPKSTDILPPTVPTIPASSKPVIKTITHIKKKKDQSFFE